MIRYENELHTTSPVMSTNKKKEWKNLKSLKLTLIDDVCSCRLYARIVTISTSIRQRCR